MSLLFAALLLCAAPRAAAKPPLESEEMVAVTQGQARFDLGWSHTESGPTRREIPAALLTLGLSDREEISVGAPYLSVDGHTGLGDIRLGTKYMLNFSDKRESGVSAQFEAKLKNGSQGRELGTGAIDYTGRFIAQEGYKNQTTYLNVAQTWVGSPLVDGQRVLRHNVRTATLTQESAVNKQVKFVNELIWNSSAVPGTPYRLAANTGVKYAVSKNFELNASMGRSLRSGNAGGPTFRGYAGMTLLFASLPPDK